MKKSLRIMSISLCITLLLSLGTACSSGSESSSTTNSSDNSSTVENSISEESTGEPTSISMYLVFDGVEYPAPGNDIQKIIEEYTNTQLEISAYGNYGDLYPTMLASGDFPDVMTTLDLPITKDAVRSGMFWDIMPYLDSTNNLKDYHPTTLENSTVDGKLIGIPKVRPLVRRTFVYRKDWADQLGLSVPTNVEEFYQFLKSYATSDLDGNGEQDTYGLIADKTVINHMCFLFGAPNVWEIKDGQAIRNFTTPEYLEGLKFMKKLVDEKILHPEWSTVSRNQFYNVFEDGTGGVMWDSTNAIQMLGARVEAKDPNASVDAFTLLTDTKGQQRTMGEAGHLGWLSIPSVVPEEKVGKIVEFFDKTADEEMASLLVWGVEGQHYNVEEGNAIPIEEAASNYEDTIRYPYKLPFSAVNYEDYARPGIYNKYQQRALDIDREMLEYMVPNPIFPLDSQTYFEMGKTLDQIIQDASIKFVSGALDESGFLAEVERWRTTGGDKVAQEYMESYNTIHGE